ncbi:MAG: M55 family metallopeptidase [Planctomycetota bacterium]|nr:M55 family metallopeptidase [Planctomycetota bacterium]
MSISTTVDAREPRIVFNDDAQMLMETPAEGATEFVKAWLDKEAAGVPFSTYVFLAATPDICTFDSKAGETYGERFGEEFSKGWTPGIRGLRAEGTDALKVVTAHMHAKGKEVLAEIRMSDTHHAHIGHTHPLCPQFAIDNRQFVIRQPDGRTNETAFDYSFPEVRQHRLNIMREIAEEYDVDGLELNFVRWAKHFPRDKGREKAPIMTAYMGEIHDMLAAAAKKRKRDRLTLGVRVPESIAACWLAGCDVETWVKRGWIDYVVVSTWNNTDPQVRVDEFARFTKPAGVDTIVVMGNMIGSLSHSPPTILDRPVAMSAKHRTHSYLAMLITESEARGAAANYYTWGADSISFWNVGIHFGGEVTANPEQQDRMKRWTHAVRTKESVFAGPRTYRYLPMGKGISSRKPPVRNYPWYDEGRSPLGHVNSPTLTFDKEAIGKRLVFPFRMADGRDGEKLQGKLTFWVYHLADDDDFAIDINGRAVEPDRIDRQPSGKRRGDLPGQRIEIALADCPPFRGDNELGLALNTGGDRAHDPYMEELEVVVGTIAKTSQPAPGKPIKILIAVDSEGPTGVDEYWARNRKPGDPEALRFRRLMTDDVNAAIEGCLAGGADEVYVKDDGFRDQNLLPDRIDKRAKLVPSGSGLLHGLDETFSGVMLVGLHAMEGAKDAVLAHTWSSSRRRRYWFNGKEGGEVAAYAIVAGHDHNVPIIMATGCNGPTRGMDISGPPLDQMLSTLIADLYERGLDRKVLLVVWGEFGRTPRVNATGGRDHWGSLMSILMAGGGLKVGQVIGTSSANGEVPANRPVSPTDVLATIYRHLGIDLTRHTVTNAGRPIPLLPDGAPIGELL